MCTNTHTGSVELSPSNPLAFYVNNVLTEVVSNNGRVFLFLITRYTLESHRKDGGDRRTDRRGHVWLRSGDKSHRPDERYIVQSAA